MNKFTLFVRDLLAMSGLNNKSILQCTDKESIEKFRTAFIHKSIDTDAVSNYELAEIMGDALVNTAIVSYIRKERFPKVVNVDWITRIKIKLISKKGLANLAYVKGFGDFIQYSEEYGANFAGKTFEELWKTHKYISLYEDTFEAFIGTMESIIDEKLSIISDRGTPTPGPGYSCVCKLVYKILDDIDIKLQYQYLWDPVTRLKKLYDKHNSLGWCFSKQVSTKLVENEDGTKIFVTRIFAYLLGNRMKTEGNENLIRIGYAESVNKDESKNTAATAALNMLQRYGIMDTPKDPYTRKN